MEEPCFDFLRTKKTLGYSVFPMIRCTYGIIGSSITVRSQIDKFTAEQVMEAVQEFLASFKKQLKAMKPAEFKGTVICRNKTPSSYWCRNKTLFERPILPWYFIQIFRLSKWTDRAEIAGG